MKRNKKLISLILIALFISCGKKDKNENNINSAKNEIKDSIPNIVSEYNINDYETYFIIVADTNKDYSMLNKKMFELNSRFNIPIDTMGRYFDKTKNLIIVPENDEDEVYAGDYFPRRFPTKNLSLEYLNFYQKSANDKTIALIAGIYEKEKSADSALIVLQKSEKNALKLKAEIYVGCIH